MAVRGLTVVRGMYTYIPTGIKRELVRFGVNGNRKG